MTQNLRILTTAALTLCFLTPLAAQAFYNPTTGRWLNRDPLEERGNPNLMCMCKNDPIDYRDVLGRSVDSRTGPRDLCCPDRFEKSCEQICRMAARNIELNRSLMGGGVVCYNKKPCPCITGDPDTGWSPGDCPEVDDIIMYHENQHVSNITCHKCGLYHAGEEDLPYSSLKDEECQQRKMSLYQLQVLVPRLPDGKCKQVAKGIMQYMEDYVYKNCP